MTGEILIFPGKKRINSKRKGMAFEHEVKHAFRDAGYSAVKTPEYTPDDVLVCLNGQDLKVECKRSQRDRGSLHKIFSDTGAHMICHRQDRKEILVTMPLSRLFELAPLKAEGRE